MPHLSPHLRRLALLAALAAPFGSAFAADEAPTTLTVGGEKLADVDPLLFGQFLEIASWGELGPEAYYDEAEEDGVGLPAVVVEKLRELHAPLIRFPAGSDLPFLDWTDRIHLPGRDEQPIDAHRGNGTLTNRFTYDHFFKLCEELDAEPLVVVRATPAAIGWEPVELIADQAAAIVAYANGVPGEMGDPELEKWAALRVENGREAPYAVKRWQVGNELFFSLGYGSEPSPWKGKNESEKREIADGIVHAMTSIGAAMRAVDPSIVLITDVDFADPDPGGNRYILEDARMRETFDLVSSHRYNPFETGSLTVNGEETDGTGLDAETVHHFASIWPGGLNDDGSARGLHEWVPRVAGKGGFGYGIATTEWNWNGWGGFDKAHPKVTAHARALGVGGYLNGLLRQADDVKLGAQSMMLAENWVLGGVRGNPDHPEEVYLTPTGRTTALYSEHHGPELRAITVEHAPAPTVVDIKKGGTAIGPEIPVLDAAATAGDGVVYLHLVHRGFEDSLPVSVHLPEGVTAAGATAWALVTDPDEPERMAATKKVDVPVTVGGAGEPLGLVLPPASVCVVRVSTGG